MKFIFLLLFVFGHHIWAANTQLQLQKKDGLTIYAAEMGIGKFHRHDHMLRQYGPDNVWHNFILPLKSDSDKTFSVVNADGSVTIFFTSLEALIKEIIKVSDARGSRVSVLNLNTHGIPGGTWFPKTENYKNSTDCADWRESAAAKDEVNYNDYYTPIEYDEIIELRKASENVYKEYACVTGLKGWQEVVRDLPRFKNIFTADAQVHFLSCLVGLGAVGEKFTEGLAQLLFSSPNARIQTALMYGLGDWSLPTGMAFWDYQNDVQLERDNEIYPLLKSDKTIQQTGTIRVATFDSSQRRVVSGFIENADYIYLEYDRRPFKKSSSRKREQTFLEAPVMLRVPGTAAHTYLK